MMHFQKVKSKNGFISIKKKKKGEKRLDEKIKKDVQVRVKLYKFEHKLHALHLTNLQLHAWVYFTF